MYLRVNKDEYISDRYQHRPIAAGVSKAVSCVYFSVRPCFNNLYSSTTQQRDRHTKHN